MPVTAASDPSLFQPTTLFGDMPDGFSPGAMNYAPPTVGALRDGIARYRAKYGYTARGPMPEHVIRDMLVGKEFGVRSRVMRIDDVRYVEIAPPIYACGDIEMYWELLVAPIAAAVAAYPHLGTGGPDRAHASRAKAMGDGAATEAMRRAFNSIYMRGSIRGGEGGGRDAMGRGAALYLGEPVGVGYGPPIDFLVDPLEVTNATKKLDRSSAYGQVGTGWDDALQDPSAWYPGYSGALSLMLCANAETHGGHGGIRPLTDYLYLNKLLVPRELPRITVESSPDEMVLALSETLDVPADQLCVAALARNRHLTTMDGWLRAGMKPWNLLTPSDGDSTFALAMGARALQMAGLSGGVVEGIIAGAAGVPVGLQTSYQFVSHERLGEHAENAELCREDHRFGFSEQEYEQMVQNRLFDGQHLGHTLRLLPEYFEIVADIFNWAARERAVEDFDFESFQKEFDDIVRHPDRGTRFSGPSRALIRKVLAERDWLDVRGVYHYPDFVRTRDWLFAATALTPNRFAPLKGLQRGTDGRYISETVVVGGSSAVGILVAESVQVK